MERYIYRNEPTIKEPRFEPIRAVVFDRSTGKYNLLNKQQRDLVLGAADGRIGETQIIKSDKPFRVRINLLTMPDNLQVVEQTDRSPKNVLSAPIASYMEISSVCNLNCRDCYQGNRVSVETLSNAEISACLERYAQIGIFIVRFTGKEPTIHPDFLKFVSQGKQLGLKMALNTNGIFDKSYRERFVEAGISEVVVSLDGNEKANDYVRGKGVYQEAVRSIRALVKDGVDTRINMTVSRRNINQLEHIAKVAHIAGAYVSYIPMRNLGNASARMSQNSLDSKDMAKISAHITALRKKYHPTRLLTYFDILGEEADYYHPMFQMTPCHARKNIFMDNEGNIFPCDHLVSLGDLFRGGNVKESDLLYIWKEGKGLNRYRSLGHNAKCEACTHFSKQCHGGCPSEYLVAEGEKATIVKDRLCFQGGDIEQVHKSILCK